MKSILFVHDTQENAWQRKHIIESAGFHVDLAPDGPTALRYLEDFQPSLILMDILLPGSNGFDVCREIRSQFSSDEIPIILTTRVYRDIHFKNESIAAGAQAYLLRPVELTDLIKVITELTEDVVKTQEKEEFVTA